MMSKNKKPKPTGPLAVSVRCSMLATSDFSYVVRHVDTTLTDYQARSLRRLVEGLQVRPHRTVNGRIVQSGADAIKWLLEQVGASADAAVKVGP